MSYTAAILVAGKSGAETYETGLPVAAMLEAEGFLIGMMEPADPGQTALKEKLRQWSDDFHINLIVSMGCEERIHEAVEKLQERTALCLNETVSVRGKTLFLTLPGDPGIAKEKLTELLPSLKKTIK